MRNNSSNQRFCALVVLETKRWPDKAGSMSCWRVWMWVALLPLCWPLLGSWQGGFQYLVGLAFGMPVLFPARTTLDLTSDSDTFYLPVISIPPSGHRSMSCLPSAAQVPARSCSVALPTAVLCRWNTSQEWEASGRNNPPASPSRTRPFLYVSAPFCPEPGSS